MCFKRKFDINNAIKSLSFMFVAVKSMEINLFKRFNEEFVQSVVFFKRKSINKMIIKK